MSKEMFCVLRKKGTLGLFVEIVEEDDDEILQYEVDLIQHATFFYDTDDAQEYQKKLREQYGVETDVIIVDFNIHDDFK